MPTQSTSSDDDCVAIMKNYYPNGVERAVLITKLIEEYGLSDVSAKVRVCRAIKQGKLLVDRKIVTLPNVMPPPPGEGSIIERGCSVV